MVQEKGVLVRRSLPVRQLCPPLVCRLECRSCIRDDCLVVAFTSGRHNLDGSVAGFADVYSVELIRPACWLVLEQRALRATSSSGRALKSPASMTRASGNADSTVSTQASMWFRN